MTWSYSGNPASSDLDRYRFLLSDTNPDEPILQDEEIGFILDTHASENMRLYQLFQRASDILARDIKKSLGPQSEDPTSRQEYFKERANYYKRACNVTGISVPVYSQPKAFRKGMHNNV